MLVSVEGIDGSGKKTQCAKLRDKICDFYANRITAAVLDFPQPSNLTGPYIKDLLKGLWSPEGKVDEMTKAIVLQALQTVNRYESMPRLLSAQHWTDDVLILDRYYASALAYGQADGLPMDFLCNIHRGLPAPALSILIDLPPEESMQRRPVREDLYESNVHFLRVVRDNYLKLFSERRTELGQAVIIDGTLDEESVHKEIFKAFEQHLQYELFI